MTDANAGPSGAIFAPSATRKEPFVLLVAAMVLLAVSAVRPYDRFTWILEVAPIFIH